MYLNQTYQLPYISYIIFYNKQLYDYNILIQAKFIMPARIISNLFVK
jgi:hypothetical protein